VARAQDTITAEDLCLDRDALSGPPRSGGVLSRLIGRRASSTDNKVTFVSVHEDEFYTVGVFALAQGSSIPLHDHPGEGSAFVTERWHTSCRLHTRLDYQAWLCCPGCCTATCT
jgi:PCO_ADO